MVTDAFVEGIKVHFSLNITRCVTRGFHVFIKIKYSPIILKDNKDNRLYGVRDLSLRFYNNYPSISIIYMCVYFSFCT